MSNSSEAYMWFVAMSFAKEGFVEHVDEKGVDEVYKFECPYSDLTPERMEHLEAVFGCGELREVHSLWWETYNLPLVREQLPTLPEGQPWQP